MRLDRSVLDRLHADLGDATVMDALLQTYLADLGNRLAAIEAATRAGDLPALARAAHGLRSPSVVLGIADIAEICRAIELRADRGSFDGVDLLVAELGVATETPEPPVTAYLDSIR